MGGATGNLVALGKTALNTIAIVAFLLSCIPVWKDKYENSILGALF
jgi:hypothetical protein